ncbi:MAG: sigma 54-dependent transcriptional regulator, partial [Gammaproteobacteria bacterium]
WSSNFRDLNASITRMATLAPGGRIDLKTVHTEIERLNKIWYHKKENRTHHLEDIHIIPKDLDPFDQIQLSYAVNICKSSNSMAEAGRKLYAFSRKAKSTPNDSDRLRKYLQKFGISWEDIKNSV